jgi:hypothetical protein
MKTFTKKFDKQVAAGERIKLAFPGSKFFVKAASADFDVQFDDGETHTLDAGGCELDFGGEYFRKCEIINLSSTDVLTVEVFIGDAGAKFTALRYPNLKSIGFEVPVTADQGTFDVPGVSTDAAKFSGAGVGVGRRRQYLTITLRPSLAGKIIVSDKRTGTLLALIGASSSGGGFPIHSSDTVVVKNDTGANITSTGATPDIAIMEVFQT